MSIQPPRPTPILFTHYGEEWIRGSERCLLDLLTYIDRERFAPVLWCNAETLATAAKALDVPVHLSRFSILFDWTPPRYQFGQFMHLVREGRRLANRLGARVLHSNSVAPTQWLFPVARGARIPLLTHMHAPYVRRERFTLGLHQTTLAVGVTHGCVEGLIEDGFPISRTKTIYNGVDLSAWKNWDYRGLRAGLGIPPEAIVITQAGSLIYRKGHDVLLRAFAELKRLRPECRLLIVGDGPDRAAIEQVARELHLDSAVHFLGFIPGGAVVFRDATDIAVSPSRAEGFGLTVIEAGAAGCPVVATETTGMTEIITSETNGLIVPIDDSARLMEALLRLVDDPALRRRLGAALQRTVQDRFTISTYVSNFESAYQRLLALPEAALGWRGSGWRGQFKMYRRWSREVVSSQIRRLIPGSASRPIPAR